jgi:L-fucose mutarotase
MGRSIAIALFVQRRRKSAQVLWPVGAVAVDASRPSQHLSGNDMLINIDPLLGPELLSVLRAMGHGEDIAIVDRNYPALSAGPQLIRQDGADGPRVLEAILSVLPLDKGAQTVTRMEVRDKPAEILPVMSDFISVAKAHAPHLEVDSLAPAEFKARASRAVAIVVTGETRVYGNILLRKGTLPV